MSAFVRQLADFMQIEVLNQQDQSSFFRRLLNDDDWRIAGKPQSTQFLDYQVVNSNIDAERDHLHVGDHVIRILTMKSDHRDAATRTRCSTEDSCQLLRGDGVDTATSGQSPQRSQQTPPSLQYVEDRFHLPDGQRPTQTNPRDVLVDEVQQADIENLGDCLRALVTVNRLATSH